MKHKIKMSLLGLLCLIGAIEAHHKGPDNPFKTCFLASGQRTRIWFTFPFYPSVNSRTPGHGPCALDPMDLSVKFLLSIIFGGPKTCLSVFLS